MMTSLLSVANAHLIEVFTLTTRPITFNGHQALLCQLDSVEQITAQMNAQMQNRKQVDEQPKETASRLTKAYVCLDKANRYGLQSLPAIVIDERYVAYGLDSVDRALLALQPMRKSAHD